MANSNTYMNEYMKNRYKVRRDFWLDKLGGLCVDCSTDQDLEFDHKDPSTKSFNVAKALSGWSASRIEIEMAKCVLRCKACHKVKSDRELSVGHGEGLTGKRNCRCDLCGPLKKEYNKRYK